MMQVLILAACAWSYLLFRGFFIADLHHNRAIFHSKRAEWEQALDNYRTVIRYNPFFMMAHYFMGNVYNDRQQEGDWKRALSKYDDVKRLAPCIA